MANFRRLMAILCLAVPVILAMGTAPAIASGDSDRNTGPVILPPDSRPFGASYAEWNARWWQWLFQTPTAISPVFGPAGDPAPAKPTGVDCSAGQSGRVWFLGGTFLPTAGDGSSFQSVVNRNCAIPEGTALFLPILNTEGDNVFCPDAAPVVAPFSADELSAYVETNIDHIVKGSMSARIDGKRVDGLKDSETAYRSTAPWFSYRLPADNLGSVICPSKSPFAPGTRPPRLGSHAGATADGVYLMLAPLSRGTHVLKYGGEIIIPDTPTPQPPAAPLDFVQDVTYTITVLPARCFNLQSANADRGCRSDS